MKRLIVFVVVAVGLTGCVSQNMDQGLQALVGQDIHLAMNALGYPTGQQPLLGETVYTWSTTQTFATTTPVTTTTTGTVGNKAVDTATTTYVPTTGTYTCTVQIAADSNNRIKSFQWQGDVGGCAGYANRLKAVAASVHAAAPPPAASFSASPGHDPSNDPDRIRVCVGSDGTRLGYMTGSQCQSRGGSGS
jgi:hypothetical protein